MYSYEERMRAVQLYIKYYFSPSDVIYEIGYPSRNRLRQWYKEYIETGTLRDNEDRVYSKYSKEQRKRAVDYYSEHGRSVSRTIKALGLGMRTFSWT